MGESFKSKMPLAEAQRLAENLKRELEKLGMEYVVICGSVRREKPEVGDLDIVVVGNAWQPTGLPDGVKGHYSPVNLGIPGGRTAGTDLVTGDYLFYLDDDAWLPTTDVVSRMLDILQARPEVGIVQPRATDPDTGVTPSRAATIPVSMANGATPARMLPQFGVVSTRPSPTTTCTNR